MASEERIAEVLGALYERLEEGEDVDVDEVLREHPELAADLKAHLGMLGLVDRALEADEAGFEATPDRIGDYLVEALLGRGGMGTVYRAKDESGSLVALKVIHPHLLQRRGFFKRFLREAAVGQSIRHENVVGCMDCDAIVQDGTQQNFLVMEYVEGQTLGALLQELDRVPEELCRHVGHEIARGLVAIHEAGVVHRDLKPENVLITKDHAVKIMDLGVARLQDEAIRLSQTGVFVGSLAYAAPEQFGAADRTVDGRADLHALGTVLYEISTGRHPFQDEEASRVLRNILDVAPRNVGELNPQLSPFFEGVVHTLLAKDPDDRFATAADLAQVLEERENSSWWKERAKALRIETRRPLRRIRIPRETALYGRDDDLAWLRAAYEKARAGEGQVLLIEGEAGVGKTRLVDEFVGSLGSEGEDLNFLSGSYPPGGAATASGAWSTAYREHFGGEALADTLRDYLPATPLLVPAFAALLSGDAAPADAQPLLKDSLQTVFVHATRALAEERPTIVLIDDLHFAPEEGRALFAALAPAVPGHRILLVGTMRPGVPETWTTGVTRLENAAPRVLARLGPKDLALLLQEAFRSERLATELGYKIALKCDGNQFFAFEIIRGLKEGQFLTQQPDGTWVTTQVIREIQVPSSVTDLVEARVADLDDDDRNLLDVASCCGFEFDPLLVAAALGLPQVPAVRRLAKIEKRHRLVRSAGRSFVFDHHQVQETLYGGLPDLLKEPYHAAIAEALELRLDAGEADPGTLDGALCVDLCEHYLRGGRRAAARRYFDAALTHLEQGYLNDRAVRLIERALAVPGLLAGGARGVVLLRLAARLDILGRREAQQAALDETLDLVREAGDRQTEVRTLWSLGWLSNSTDEFARAQLYFERSLELAREIGDRFGEALATGHLGMVLGTLGHYAEAQAQQERQLALAREIGDRGQEAQATGHLGAVLMHRGEHEEALELAGRWLALARENDDQTGEASALGNMGLSAGAQGRFGEAMSYFERQLAVAREIGWRRSEAMATGGLAFALKSLGRFPEAQEQCERQVALAREIGAPGLENQGVNRLGQIFYYLGYYAEALDCLERSLTAERELGARIGECLGLESMGQLRLHLGDLPGARRDLGASLSASHAIGNPYLKSRTLRVLANVDAEADDVDAADQRMSEALGVQQAGGYRDEEAETLLQRGVLRLQAGRAAEAQEDLEAVLAITQDLPLPAMEVAARAHLACLLEGSLDDARAALTANEARVDVRVALEAHFALWQAAHDASHLDHARRILDHLVEHAPEEYRESMIENVALYRDIELAWSAQKPGDGEEP